MTFFLAAKIAAAVGMGVVPAWSFTALIVSFMGKWPTDYPEMNITNTTIIRAVLSAITFGSLAGALWGMGVMFG